MSPVVQQLQVDAYIERVLQILRDAQVNEIEVSPEGHWRPSGSTGPFRNIDDPSDVDPVQMYPVCISTSDHL